jgi:hypothetical protein
MGNAPVGVWTRPFSWQIPLSATALTEISALNNEFWDGFLIFSMYRRQGRWDNRNYVAKRSLFEISLLLFTLR